MLSSSRSSMLTSVLSLIYIVCLVQICPLVLSEEEEKVGDPKWVQSLYHTDGHCDGEPLHGVTYPLNKCIKNMMGAYAKLVAFTSKKDNEELWNIKWKIFSDAACTKETSSSLPMRDVNDKQACRGPGEKTEFGDGVLFADKLFWGDKPPSFPFSGPRFSFYDDSECGSLIRDQVSNMNYCWKGDGGSALPKDAPTASFRTVCSKESLGYTIRYSDFECGKLDMTRTFVPEDAPTATDPFHVGKDKQSENSGSDGATDASEDADAEDGADTADEGADSGDEADTEEEADSDADASADEETDSDADASEEETPETDADIPRRHLGTKSRVKSNGDIVRKRRRYLADEADTEEEEEEEETSAEEVVDVSETENEADADTAEEDTTPDKGADPNEEGDEEEEEEVDTSAAPLPPDPASFCFPLSARTPKNKVYRVVESCYVNAKNPDRFPKIGERTPIGVVDKTGTLGPTKTYIPWSHRDPTIDYLGVLASVTPVLPALKAVAPVTPPKGKDTSPNADSDGKGTDDGGDTGEAVDTDVSDTEDTEEPDDATEEEEKDEEDSTDADTDADSDSNESESSDTEEDAVAIVDPDEEDASSGESDTDADIETDVVEADGDTDGDGENDKDSAPDNSDADSAEGDNADSDGADSDNSNSDADTDTDTDADTSVVAPETDEDTRVPSKRPVRLRPTREPNSKRPTDAPVPVPSIVPSMSLEEKFLVEERAWRRKEMHELELAMNCLIFGALIAGLIYYLYKHYIYDMFVRKHCDSHRDEDLSEDLEKSRLLADHDKDQRITTPTRRKDAGARGHSSNQDALMSRFPNLGVMQLLDTIKMKSKSSRI